MSSIATLLAEAAADCLRSNRDKLWLAIRQRAKFEGWLKIELAEALRLQGFEPHLEVSYWRKGRNSKRADVSFLVSGVMFHLLLKTANTNWRMEQVESMTRPVTKNYQAVLGDIDSLKTLLTNDRGIALAVLFPTESRTSEELGKKMERSRIGAHLLKERPLISFVDFQHGVRAAVLTFGPY